MKSLPLAPAFLAAALCLALQGCVPSLRSIVTDEVQVFKAELLGTWSDDNSTWTFEKDGDKGYSLIFAEDEKTGSFEAALVELDGSLYLDLKPKDAPDGAAGFWQYHFIASHTFLLVEEIGPKLKMRLMNPQWLKDHLEAHPDAIAAEIVEDRPILTASTPELHKFLAALPKRDDAKDTDDGPFTKPSELMKK